ncbi:MAG: PAS domain S-box protein, partial [Acidobacteriota bacterium]
RQRALRDSESKYRLLVENQTDLVIKVDKEGRFQFVSPSYCETFRYSEEDLLGREFMPRVHEDDRVSTLEVMEALEHPPHTAYFEQKAMTDKGWRWFAWVDTAVFDGDGRINGVIGVGRDITERKKLEEQLMRSQKMEAVGLVAGGIAHDFNNLLQSIFGNLHFALAAVQEEGALRDDLLATQKNAESAAELIRQLLTFSRKQPIEAKPTHLNQVIDGMTSMLRRVISESISLEFFPDQSLGVVCVDAQQIEQLLLNLCANSRDAMPDGGMLAISTKSVTDRQEVLSLFPDDPPPDGLALLRVRDSGHGMDEEVSDRAFEPFFTTKGIDQGTGLGLSSVYGIVQQHGGLINIESAVGVGTTVTVCFPVVEEEVRVAEAGAPFSPVEGSGELILVAEDDPQILDLARKILIQAGYGVLCAGNGRDAFALFEDNWDRISLVLTDIIMPGMGGKELRDRIVEHRPGFPVLFSSGYGINEIDAQGELHSTVPIIHKPYDGPTLVNRIRTLIAGR